MKDQSREIKRLRSVVLETDDDYEAASIAKYFRTHLVSVIRRRSRAFKKDTGAYIKADAVIIMESNSGRDILPYVAHLGSTIPAPLIVLSPLSASKRYGIDIIDAGATDFLPAPADRRELLARVRARLRRFEISKGERSLAHFRFENFTFDFARKQLWGRNTMQRLSSKQANLLHHFVRNAFVVLSRYELLEVLNAGELEILDRSVDALVSRLRGTLRRGKAGFDPIKTIRGFGYVFDCEVHVDFTQQKADQRRG